MKHFGWLHKTKLWRKLGDLLEKVADVAEERSMKWEEMMPHCDPSVLHAPGDCEYCDHYPRWQEYRLKARINFTGQSAVGCAPCPSTYFRPVDRIEEWGGNVPSPTEAKVMEDYNRIKSDLEQGKF